MSQEPWGAVARCQSPPRVAPAGDSAAWPGVAGKAVRSVRASHGIGGSWCVAGSQKETPRPRSPRCSVAVTLRTPDQSRSPWGPCLHVRESGCPRVPRGLEGGQAPLSDSVSPAVLTVCLSVSADLWLRCCPHLPRGPAVLAPRSPVPCVSAAAWGKEGASRKLEVGASRRKSLKIKIGIYKPAGSGDTSSNAEPCLSS